MTALTNNRPDVVVEDTGNRPAVMRRISWSSVIAGVLIALIVQVAMNILGLAIGSAILDPDAPRNALGPTFSTGAVVWIGASTLLSLFAGGYVAARMSSNINRFDAMLHGLLVWALATLLSFALLWSTASSIISGVSGLVGEGLSMIGMGAAEAAPEVAQALTMQEDVFTSINDQASRAGVEADAPNNTALMMAMGSLLRAEPGSTAATDAHANAVSVLTGQGMSQAEADALVTGWETQYRQSVDEVARMTEEAAENLADATAVTSGILFLMMVLGAFAGGMGGVSGRPRRLRVVRAPGAATATTVTTS
jgi:hypothetical protein